jgi:hypothetical protein
MKVNFACEACGSLIEVDAQQMPPEYCGGRLGFYAIEAICNICGHEIETVIRERSA